MSDQYPVKLSKDGVDKLAFSNADVVDLKFRGYRPTQAELLDEPEREPAYAELVAQAQDLQDKGHDLKANGSYEDLLAAVTEAQTLQNEIEAV